MDRTSVFYSRPSYVGGAGSIYAGSRRQRGGSVLGALKSVVTPVLSGVGQSLKKNAMNNAFGLATDVVGDMFSGKNLQSSLIHRGKQRGLRTLHQTFADLKRTPLRRTRKVPMKRKKKRVVGRRRRQIGSGKRRPRKKHSRKRAASRKRKPSAKRRRRNF